MDRFSVGFGRADMTPEESVPLYGYGNPKFRRSERILDPLYVTCVALRDGAGERLLLMQLDIINTPTAVTDPMRAAILEETGIDGDHILINATHTHSAPTPGGSDPAVVRWLLKTTAAAVRAAKDALLDLAPCVRFSTGKMKTDRLNFVRRYYTENGFVSSNVTQGSGAITAHETEVDEEMRILRFDREDRPAIVIANWQCHNHRTGGAKKHDLSADFIGVLRDRAEEDLGVRFLYLQGGAGNVNPHSRIKGESRVSDYKDVGAALCEHLKQGLKGMTERPLGKIRVLTASIDGVVNHPTKEKLAICKEVFDRYDAGDTEGAEALAKENGMTGAIEARAMYRNDKLPPTRKIGLQCCAIGDVGLTAAPFEMFCQTEKVLREASPFDFTISCGYSNTSHGYMPAAESFPNKGYEVFQCHYVKGTAERINAKQLEMLGELAAGR